MRKNKNYQNLNKLEKENKIEIALITDNSKFLSLSQESINSINSNNEEIYSNKKDWKLAVKNLKKKEKAYLKAQNKNKNSFVIL